MAVSKGMYITAMIAFVLVIVGALNWLWIGLTNNNIITTLNNATFKNETFERFIYVLVGLAALFLIYFHIAYAKDFKSVCA